MDHRLDETTLPRVYPIPTGARKHLHGYDIREGESMKSACLVRGRLQ